MIYNLISTYRLTFITEVLSFNSPLPVEIAHLVAVLIGRSQHVMKEKGQGDKQGSLWQVTSIMDPSLNKVVGWIRVLD